MIRTFLLAVVVPAVLSFFVAAGPVPAIQQTSWRTYNKVVGDTVTLNFHTDSAAILSPTGVPVWQSTFKLKNDVITFHDYGGMNPCHDLTGSYHVRITGDTLTLVLAEDPCDGRTGTLITRPWIRKR